MHPWPHHRKGVKFTPDQLKRLSDSHKGFSPNEKQLSALKKGREGEGSFNWKGDDVGYFSLHKWVRRHLGRPTHCSECGKPDSGVKRTNIHWANISKKYLRKLDDWIALCCSCHKLWDKGKIELTSLQHSQ